MKTIGPYTISLFAGRQFQMANIFNFSLIDSTQLNYSSGDCDIFLNTSAPDVDVASYWNNQTFSCGRSTGGPFFDREDNKFKAHWKRGVEVDTIQFDVIPSTSQIEGTNFLSAVREGVFDGAEVTVYGAYWPQQVWLPVVTPTGTIIKFVGRVAEVDCGRSLATFTVNSHLELLNQNMPRNLWQQSCVNTLYDASCTLSQGSFTNTGAATSGSTSLVINDATLSAASGYYSLGVIKFTSGVNDGLSRCVSLYAHGSPNTISLMQPFPNAPGIGDTFNISAGCNKLQSTCNNTFSNLVNFRGFPFVPSSETAV
jgi:uncharacterized phage protein (TIGR02218 family)